MCQNYGNTHLTEYDILYRFKHLPITTIIGYCQYFVCRQID